MKRFERDKNTEKVYSTFGTSCSQEMTEVCRVCIQAGLPSAMRLLPSSGDVASPSSRSCIRSKLAIMLLPVSRVRVDHRLLKIVK